MNFVMISKFTEQSKSLLALGPITDVSILADMQSFMLIEISSLSEGFRAVRTFVRTFAGLKINFKNITVYDFNIANYMCPSMTIQVVRREKSHIAKLTCIRSFTRVNSIMFD